jgi:hypothetical protein
MVGPRVPHIQRILDESSESRTREYCRGYAASMRVRQFFVATKMRAPTLTARPPVIRDVQSLKDHGLSAPHFAPRGSAFGRLARSSQMQGGDVSGTRLPRIIELVAPTRRPFLTRMPFAWARLPSPSPLLFPNHLLLLVSFLLQSHCILLVSLLRHFYCHQTIKRNHFTATLQRCASTSGMLSTVATRNGEP